ncbi:hypothetical protein Egran_00822 [Elaphomyces granulatus]|uniref:Uncharacterized protein n=1 Tax=Elaphomyces granulatus TaxID=519963 RepID=A0A232M5Q4_9EURO|nr:hypothetical protein Egran_00822 [Elaphomyces granulatus]
MKTTRSSAPSDESRSGSPGTILETITHKIDESLTPMRTAASQLFQAEFDMDWDLTNFLRRQEYDATWETAVELAITLTGSNGNAQALTCMDYMCQTWPLSGRVVVRLLQKALVSPALSCSGFLVGGTEVDIDLTSPRALIVARGSQAALTELCGQLSWLGAALRTSPRSSGIGFSTPSISVTRSSTALPSVTVRIGYTDTDYGLSPDEGSASCWRAMFRNPLIVNGFPILARPENELGLELPLGMMAETRFATHYGSTLVLKGPCTMLIPTYRTERSITWHFLFNEDGERIPYYSFRKRCSTWIGTDKAHIGLLEDRNMRHFVGWASHVTRHLGTEDMPYDKIDWSGAKSCTTGLAVEQKLTARKRRRHRCLAHVTNLVAKAFYLLKQTM